MNVSKAKSRSSFGKRGGGNSSSDALSMVDSFLAPWDCSENVASSEPVKDIVKTDTHELWQSAATRRKMVSEIKRQRPQITEIQSQANNYIGDTTRQAGLIVQYNTLSKQLRDFKFGVRSSAAVCIQRAWRRSRGSPVRCVQNFFPFGRAEVLSELDYRATVCMPSSKAITSLIRVPNVSHPGVSAHTVCGSEEVHPVPGPVFNAVGCGICSSVNICACGQWTLLKPSGPVYVACVKTDSAGAAVLFDTFQPLISNNLFGQCNRQAGCIKCSNGAPQGVCACVYDGANRLISSDSRKPVFESAVRSYLGQHEPHLLQHGEPAVAKQYTHKTNLTPSPCVSVSSTCGSVKIDTLVPLYSSLLDSHEKPTDAYKHLRTVTELNPYISVRGRESRAGKSPPSSLTSLVQKIQAALLKGPNKAWCQWNQLNDSTGRWPEPYIDSLYVGDDHSFDQYISSAGSGYSIDITRSVQDDSNIVSEAARKLGEHQGVGYAHYIRSLRSLPGHNDLKHSLYSGLGTQRQQQQEGIVLHPLLVDQQYSVETAVGGYHHAHFPETVGKTSQNVFLQGHPLTGASFTQMLPPIGNVMLSSSVLRTDVVVGSMRGTSAVSVNKGVGLFVTMVGRGGSAAGNLMNQASSKERSALNIHLPLEGLTSKKIESIRSSLKKLIARRQQKPSTKSTESVCTGTPVCIGVNSVGLIRGSEQPGKAALHETGSSMFLGTLSEDDKLKYRPLYAFYSQLKNLFESPKPLAYRNDQFCSVPHAMVGGTSIVDCGGDVLVVEEKGASMQLDQAGFYKDKPRPGVWSTLPVEAVFGLDGEDEDVADIDVLTDTASIWQTCQSRMNGIDTSIWSGVLTCAALGVNIVRGKAQAITSGARSGFSYIQAGPGSSAGLSGVSLFKNMTQESTGDMTVVSSKFHSFLKGSTDNNNTITGTELTALTQKLNCHFRSWLQQVLTLSTSAVAYPCLTQPQPLERQAMQPNPPSLRDLPWVDNPTVSVAVLHAQDASSMECSRCHETAHLQSSSLVLQAHSELQPYIRYPEEAYSVGSACTACPPEAECKWLGERAPSFYLPTVGRTSGGAYQLVAQLSGEFDRRTAEHNTAMQQQAQLGAAATIETSSIARDLVKPVHQMKPDQPAKPGILQLPPQSDPTYNDALAALRKEKKVLQYDLNTFEREFEASTGRKIKYQTDIFPVEEKWQRYRFVKA